MTQQLYPLNFEESTDGLEEEDLVRKYAQLRTLSDFLKTFDTSVFGKLNEVDELENQQQNLQRASDLIGDEREIDMADTENAEENKAQSKIAERV